MCANPKPYFNFFSYAKMAANVVNSNIKDTIYESFIRRVGFYVFQLEAAK
jgi:hypothetical protein